MFVREWRGVVLFCCFFIPKSFPVGVHRYGGKVFTVTTNTNDSQEKNDESLEKNVATADKNDFFAVAVAKRLQKGANEAKRSSAVHAAA